MTDPNNPGGGSGPHGGAHGGPQQTQGQHGSGAHGGGAANPSSGAASQQQQQQQILHQQQVHAANQAALKALPVNPSLTKTSLSARGKRAYHTRLHKSFIKAVDSLRKNTIAFNERELKNVFDDYTVCHSELMKKYEWCLSLDNGSDDACKLWETKMKDIQTQMDDDRELVSDAMADMIAAHPQAAPQPVVSSSTNPDPLKYRGKVNDALKPFELTLDHTPTELCGWFRKFEAFYNTSQLSQAPVADQQAYGR